jgi:hypothetical protein
VQVVDEGLSGRANTRRLTGTAGEHHLHIWAGLRGCGWDEGGRQRPTCRRRNTKDTSNTAWFHGALDYPDFALDYGDLLNPKPGKFMAFQHANLRPNDVSVRAWRR